MNKGSTEPDKDQSYWQIMANLKWMHVNILDNYHSQEENNYDYHNFLPFKLGQVHRSR